MVADVVPAVKYIMPIVKFSVFWLLDDQYRKKRKSSYKQLDIWITTIFTIEFHNNFSVLICVVYIFCDPVIPACPVLGVTARRNQTMHN